MDTWKRDHRSVGKRSRKKDMPTLLRIILMKQPPRRNLGEGRKANNAENLWFLGLFREP